jgi:hypothetical protein
MRKFLLGVLLLPALVVAQPVTVEKPVICEKTELVIESLQKGEYKENPSWIGYDDKSKYALFVNEKTRTWTMIQFNENIACLIGTGEGSKQIFMGPGV